MKELEKILQTFKNRICTYPDPTTCSNYCQLFQVCANPSVRCYYRTSTDATCKDTSNILQETHNDKGENTL